MIRLRGIVKAFGARKVLNGIDLTVTRGECVVLTGSPASGRTTLLRIAASLLAPTSGTVEIDGVDAHGDPTRARKRLAFADGWIAPGDEMQASEYLQFAASLKTRGPADDAVRRSGLDPGARLDALDARQRRTLAAACALATRRDVILLDQPFTDAAPSSLVEWIDDVTRSGSAVIVASDGVSMKGRTLEISGGRLAPPAGPRAAAGASR